MSLQKNMTKPKPIKFNELDQQIYVSSPGMVGQWCCKCKTRHIWILSIIKGDKNRPDFIEAVVFPDEKATKLRKFYDKSIAVKAIKK
jgi:hypothetical protein